MPAQGGHPDCVAEERGTAIWYLLVAVALLGMLAYVLLQGSRGNVSMITDEAAKTAAYQSQDCTNAVSMGMKRLQTRGCADLISLEADGSNPHTGAPTDGSCSMYHPNGGGVAPCNIVIAAADPCTTGPIGTVCTTDGAIYIGGIGANRIYAAAVDEGGTLRWKTVDTYTPDAESDTDGLANTNAMIAAGAADHPAGNACATKPPAGTWYLPAKDELVLLWDNGNRKVPPGPLDLDSMGISSNASVYYWSSTQSGSANAWLRRMHNGEDWLDWKPLGRAVRCVRRGL